MHITYINNRMKDSVKDFKNRIQKKKHEKANLETSQYNYVLKYIFKRKTTKQFQSKISHTTKTKKSSIHVHLYYKKQQ